MDTKIMEQNGVRVAVIHSTEKLITNIQSALDFIMTVKHDAACSRIALNKEAINEDFFILSTCLAGEVLQKFINYQVKFAVFGDFTEYTSKPLKDFIYESNCGNNVFFVATEKDATDKLLSAE